jgi:hypothetical protein
MAVTTTIARHYYWRLVIMAVACLVFGLWGAYDLWVTIPAKEQRFQRYEELQKRNEDLEAQSAANGGKLPEALQNEYDDVNRELKEVTVDGAPTAPAAYDRATQWLFISCILMVPYFWLELARVKKRVYSIDDDGTIHLPKGTQPSETWRPSDVADIDMNRWMAKSLAWLVHSDGTRIKLDDYKHRNLHLIVGAVASRLYPDQWTAEAKPVKTEEEAAEPETGEQVSDDAGPQVADDESLAEVPPTSRDS